MRKIWSHPANRALGGLLAQARCLRPSDLCADIGTNVGIYSLLIARRAGATNVHAFECLRGHTPSCFPTG